MHLGCFFRVHMTSRTDERPNTSHLTQGGPIHATKDSRSEMFVALAPWPLLLQEAQPQRLIILISLQCKTHESIILTSAHSTKGTLRVLDGKNGTVSKISAIKRKCRALDAQQNSSLVGASAPRGTDGKVHADGEGKRGEPRAVPRKQRLQRIKHERLRTSSVQYQRRIHDCVHTTQLQRYLILAFHRESWKGGQSKLSREPGHAIA